MSGKPLPEHGWHHVDVEGKTHGPKSLRHMVKRFISNKIGPGTYVWNGNNMTEWAPIRSLKTFMSYLEESKEQYNITLNNINRNEQNNNPLRLVRQMSEQSKVNNNRPKFKHYQSNPTVRSPQDRSKHRDSSGNVVNSINGRPQSVRYRKRKEGNSTSMNLIDSYDKFSKQLSLKPLNDDNNINGIEKSEIKKNDSINVNVSKSISNNTMIEVLEPNNEYSISKTNNNNLSNSNSNEFPKANKLISKEKSPVNKINVNKMTYIYPQQHNHIENIPQTLPQNELQLEHKQQKQQKQYYESKNNSSNSNSNGMYKMAVNMVNYNNIKNINHINNNTSNVSNFTNISNINGNINVMKRNPENILAIEKLNVLNDEKEHYNDLLINELDIIVELLDEKFKDFHSKLEKAHQKSVLKIKQAEQVAEVYRTQCALRELSFTNNDLLSLTNLNLTNNYASKETELSEIKEISTDSSVMNNNDGINEVNNNNDTNNNEKHSKELELKIEQQLNTMKKISIQKYYASIFKDIQLIKKVIENGRHIND